jgi:hypothetical protein
MSGSLVMSAMTVVALTGITLTTLKYNHISDDEFNENDDNSSETFVPIYYNPKFQYDVNQSRSLTSKNVVKRSSENLIQYSIDDENLSMVDEMKREKVKEVGGREKK